jgi:ssDNA-binding Zn-finger/Zn-ribbon topoisomerase 1
MNICRDCASQFEPRAYSTKGRCPACYNALIRARYHKSGKATASAYYHRTKVRHLPEVRVMACPTCRITFTTTTRDKVYCSPMCRPSGSEPWHKAYTPAVVYSTDRPTHIRDIECWVDPVNGGRFIGVCPKCGGVLDASEGRYQRGCTNRGRAVAGIAGIPRCTVYAVCFDGDEWNENGQGHPTVRGTQTPNLG